MTRLIFHCTDPVGEIITQISTKRGRAAVMGKIVSLGLVDDRKQLYKKRGGKASRKSGQGHDSGDIGLYSYYCKKFEFLFSVNLKY